MLLHDVIFDMTLRTVRKNEKARGSGTEICRYNFQRYTGHCSHHCATLVFFADI